MPPTVSNKEAIEMMTRCIAELQGMRQHIAKLEPAADAYNSIRKVLSLLPQSSQGYSEDLVWTLQKRIKELETNDAKPI